MFGLTSTLKLFVKEWQVTKELSKLNKHLIMGHKWLEESHLKKLEPLILDYPSSKTVNKPKNKLVVMLLSFMFLLQELLMQY